MQKRFGFCIFGLLLIAVNGFGQTSAVPAAPAVTSAPAVTAAPAVPLAQPEVGALPSPDKSMGYDGLKARADTALQQGDTNTAINLLANCHEMSLQQSADALGALLNILMKAGKLQEAEFVYQNTVAQNDSLPQYYYRRLYQYHAAQSNDQAMLEWASGLQSKTLPANMRAQAFAWLFEASRKVGPLSRVTDLVPVCITNFDISISRNLLGGIVAAYYSAGDQASANKVLDAIERAPQCPPELRRLVTCQRVNMLFAVADWKEAEARFQKEAKALPDAELAGCFQYARACAIRNNQSDLLDRMCAWIFKEQKKKTATWQAAAGAWLESAKARKATGDIPVRLEKLMQMGCPAKNLAMFYYTYWDAVIKANKPADLLAMMQFGEKLSAAVPDEQDKEMIRVYSFDGFVIQENYERALQIIEKPFPNMKPAAQQIAINKIKAHIALQKGNKTEAVERFRAFMETVKTWTEPEVDPVTGLIYSKEMCLGLNAKRIGDILSSTNDAKGAQAAYQEANDYYVAAQKTAKADSPESEYIKARLAELAKLQK